MRPVRIRLHGKYWDSYLYNDNLILLTRDGDLEVYRWDRLVERLMPTNPALEAPLRHAVARGRAWYALAVQDLIHQGPLAPELRSSLEELSEEVLSLPRSELQKLRRSVQDVALFPSNDIEVFSNVLFVGSTDGVVTADIRRLEDADLSRASLISDAPALKLAASYSRLAVAHGENGLSELPVSNWLDYYDSSYGISDFPAPDYRISDTPCTTCSWASFDIVASNPGGGGYVSAFSSPSRRDPDGRYDRELLGTVPSSELFGAGGGLLVGAGSVLLLASEGELRAKRWNPFRRREHHGVDVSRSVVAGPEHVRSTKGPEPIDAAVTVFGVVLELDDRLVVYGSDGERRSLAGEPVSWRVFQRSQRYLNHLHVVRDRWIDIYAFTHDYFTPNADRELAMERPKANSW